MDNLKIYYPSFNEKENESVLNDCYDSKITKIDKIKALFEFRIPYFVGPLNTNNKNSKSYAWLIKNADFATTKIRPWNYEKVIDLNKTKQEFINRMLNNCTYVNNEKTLPKDSILYQKFNVLNELNNLKINGESINNEIKKDIYYNLFLKKKKVNIKQILNHLLENKIISTKDDLKGYDEKVGFKSSMKSYFELKNILGDNYTDDLAEKIIKNIVYSLENKNEIEKLLKEQNILLDEIQMKEIKKLNYKDWGRLSEKFLIGIKFEDRETGEINNLIGFLIETNKNSMQLLSSKYTLEEELEKINKNEKIEDLSYENVDALNASPSVKKMIWQTIKMIKETINYINKFSNGEYNTEPKKIFIEMVRGSEDNKKRRDDSRKNQLSEIYKRIKSGEYDDIINELDSKTNDELKNIKLYLYFTQLGKCMYSGESINLNELYNENIYDIDHIIPQSIKFDDSLINNKVLVKRIENENKKNIYPINQNIINKNIKFWKSLLELNLISKEKYDRLTRTNPLTEEERIDFIERQIVETRQITKELANILKNYYENTNIVYVKALNVSNFRNEFEIYKCRDLNDLHHAHDAYLNIVVGNVYNEYFTNNIRNFIKEKNNNYSVKFDTIFKNKNRPIFEKNKRIIWETEKTIETVINNIDNKIVIFTKEEYEQKGKLFDATIIKGIDIKEKTVYLPLKKKFEKLNYENILDMYKNYGAYSSLNSAYFVLLQKDEKNQKNIFFDFMPLTHKYIFKTDKEIENYFQEKNNDKSIKLINKKILFKKTLRINGVEYTLVCRTGGLIVLEFAFQPKFNIYQTNKFKKILDLYNKYLEKNNKYLEKIENKDVIELINILKNKLNSYPYTNRFNIPKYINHVEIEKLNKENLIKFMIALLNLIKTRNGRYSNFTFLDKNCLNSDYIYECKNDDKFVKDAGKINISISTSNKNIKEFSIVNKSVTGLYSNIVTYK